MKLTAKEDKEHKRLSRKLLLGQNVTMKEVRRALVLLRKSQQS